MGNICGAEQTDSNDLEEPYLPLVKKLPPEMVAHILRNLTHLPSRIAASGVCRLWRELIHWDWADFKELQLDFAQLHINNIYRPLAKWTQALSSLLPNVQLTSISATLPKNDVKAVLLWPLALLDCGIALPRLQPYLTSVSLVNINGGPSSPELGFICAICWNSVRLSLSSTFPSNDRFDLRSLCWALSGKRIESLSIKLAHLTGHCDAKSFAKLCQALNPATLKSLAIVTGEDDPADHPQVFCFDHWCTDLWDSDQRLHALEELKIGARRLVLTQGFDPPNFRYIQHYIMPHIRMVEFSFPLLQWNVFYKLVGPLNVLSRASRIDISLLTSHCWLLRLSVGLDNLYREFMNGPFDAQATPRGFSCSLQFPCHDAQMQLVCERLVGQCKCDLCCSEFTWVRAELIRLLKLIAPEDNLRLVPQEVCVYSCLISVE